MFMFGNSASACADASSVDHALLLRGGVVKYSLGNKEITKLLYYYVPLLYDINNTMSNGDKKKYSVI